MTLDHYTAYRTAEDAVRQALQAPADAMREREIYLHPAEIRGGNPSAFIKIQGRVYELKVNLIAGGK